MTEDNKPLKWALEYGKAGYRVFPCRVNGREPATRNGLHDASADEAEIRAMFTNPSFNIGLACGQQPNGVNLLVVDIDAHKGGDESFAELCPELTVKAPHHLTPSGGSHLFFDAPEGFRNTRERLGQGIDTRAEGGYVIVPPSMAESRSVDGPRPYTATGATALLTNDPPSVPGWLLSLLSPSEGERQVDPQDLPERGSPRPAGPGVDDESPGDWIRRTGSYPAALERAGWSHVRGEYWARPGKSVRDGHSAVLHESGALVVFTTEVPPELERVGHVTVDGTGFAVSLFEFITAYEFGGDMAEAGRSIRRAMPRPTRGYMLGGDESGADRDARPPTQDVGGLNLPDEFWEARPILAQIRQAAHAKMCGADALLANCLTRTAALIPPSIKLPAIIGSAATVDYIGCVVAKSSEGKSIGQGVASDLIPDPALALDPLDRKILFDQPIGSGEGLVDAFLLPEFKDDENGKSKPTGRRTVQRQAVHVVVDEGKALVGMAQRKGTTILPTMVSAWSGAALGQLNASAETRRVIDPGRVRVSCVLNMQTANAHYLFEEELVALGFTSRVLFAWGADKLMPRPADRPEWPGPLDFPIPATYTNGHLFMTYDDEITDEVLEARYVAVTEGVTDVARGHSNLLRLKTAAILAVWEGRTHVTVDDWSLATEIVTTSSSVLAMLQALEAQQAQKRRHMASEMRGENEYVAESAKERKIVDELSRKIIESIPDDGIGRGALGRKLTSSKTRHRYEAALDRAIASGHVRIDDGRIVRS
jgi:hypothetical protein